MRAMVLLSGGLDSSVCLSLAVKKHGADNVMGLCVYYGQKHKKEMDAARKVASFYGVELLTLNLGELFRNSECSLLEGSDKEIAHEDYSEQVRKAKGQPVDTYVPFRNGLFLSSAAAIALSHGCGEIYYGAHADDGAGSAYPDTSLEFNQSISEAIYLGSGKELSVIAPFIEKTKADVVAAGIEAGTPFEFTWSCYEGRDKACGLCGTCRDRLLAFSRNGIKDPIEYEQES